MSSWKVIINPSLTDEQVDIVRQKMLAAQTRGLTMVGNEEKDTFIIVGLGDEESRAEAEIIARALNEAAIAALQPAE